MKIFNSGKSARTRDPQTEAEAETDDFNVGDDMVIVPDMNTPVPTDEIEDADTNNNINNIPGFSEVFEHVNFVYNYEAQYIGIGSIPDSEEDSSSSSSSSSRDSNRHNQEL